MKRQLPAYVYRKGRAGHLYFCRFGSTTRIHAAPGTPEFADAYARLLAGRATVPAGKTFAAVIASYRAGPRFAKLKPRTRADYDKVLTFIADRLGDLDCTRIQRRHVIAYRDQNAGATRFANYLVQVLRIVLEHALDLGLRTDNPARGVALLKSDRAPRQPWPPALIEAFRTKAPAPARLIFELALGTGQRIGDVLRMRWNDLEAGGVNVRQGKTGAALWIPLTPALRATLDTTPKRGLTIACNPDGRPMAYRTAQAHVMAVRALIGAKAFDLHALRYTAAAELAAAGCSDDLIMAVTGHSTKAMVAQYAGAARQKARATQAQGARNRTGADRES
jgi:integrase